MKGMLLAGNNLYFCINSPFEFIELQESKKMKGKKVDNIENAFEYK